MGYEEERDQLFKEFVDRRSALEREYPYKGGLDGGVPVKINKALTRECYDKLVQLKNKYDKK